VEMRHTWLTERHDRIVWKGMGEGAAHDPSGFGFCLDNLRFNGRSCDDDAKDKQET